MVGARWTVSLNSYNGLNDWVIPKMFKFNFKLLAHCKERLQVPLASFLTVLTGMELELLPFFGKLCSARL